MRILFFFLSGERTGSEVALHNIVTNADRRVFRMAVSCRREGELLRQLPPDVPVFVEGRGAAADTIYGRAYRKVARRLAGGDGLAAAVGGFRPDLCYVNTVTQAAVLRAIKRRRLPCVLHSHEMEQMLWGLDEQDARDLVEYPELIIACSEAAAEVLRLLGRKDRLEVCYETIDPRRIVTDAGEAAAVRGRLHIPESAFVWAMAGSRDPNKNPALFAELAGHLSRQGFDARFLWIGGAENGYSQFVRGKAEALGVADRVTWLGAQTADYYHCLNAADGLVLTSSRESFSIVSAEAAYLGKPVVAFDCGGVREIVAEGMGEIVKSWDPSDLARAMAGVMSGATRFDPQVARERVKEFDVAVQVRRWERIMRKYFGGAAAPRAS